jgi:hypothetical protein
LSTAVPVTTIDSVSDRVAQPAIKATAQAATIGRAYRMGLVPSSFGPMLEKAAGALNAD